MNAFRLNSEYDKLRLDAQYYSLFSVKVLAKYARHRRWLVPYILTRFMSLISRTAYVTCLPIELFDDFVQECLCSLTRYTLNRIYLGYNVDIDHIKMIFLQRAYVINCLSGRYYKSPIPMLCMNYAQSVQTYKDSPYLNLDFSRGSDYLLFQLDSRCSLPMHPVDLTNDVRDRFSAEVCCEESTDVDTLTFTDEKEIARIDSIDFLRTILDLFPEKYQILLVAFLVFGGSADVLRHAFKTTRRSIHINLNAMMTTINMLYNVNGDVICDKELEKEIKEAKHKWPNSPPFCSKVINKMLAEKSKYNEKLAYKTPKKTYNIDSGDIYESSYRFVQRCHKGITD